MLYLADSIPLLLPEEGILWIDQTLQAQISPPSMT